MSRPSFWLAERRAVRLAANSLRLVRPIFARADLFLADAPARRALASHVLQIDLRRHGKHNHHPTRATFGALEPTFQPRKREAPTPRTDQCLQVQFLAVDALAAGRAMILSAIRATHGKAPAKREGLPKRLYRHGEQIGYIGPEVKVIRGENSDRLYLSRAQEREQMGSHPAAGAGRTSLHSDSGR
jgi:hypothetical protein